MGRPALYGSTVAALLLCAAPAAAQMQQKPPDEKGGQSQMQREPGAQKDQAQQRRDTGKGEAGPQGDMKGKSAQEPTEPKGKAGTAERGAEPKDKATKGTAEKAGEPKDKATKGTAEKAGEPKDKATKGTAEKAGEPKDKATKGTAGTEPKDKATKGTAGTEPKDKAAGTEPSKQGEARVQVSEQQRTNVHQTLIKERNLNRATNVNISVSIGSRLPRSVRLAALPASVIAIVPEFRRYQYVVVQDRIVIVEPATFEVVEVIEVSGQHAARGGGGARLVLTDQEKIIILREIDMRSTSTLGLGAVSEGADVPSSVEVHTFSAPVVQKVPKLKGYKFFTAENRVAIVDPQGSKVQLVIEANR